MSKASVSRGRHDSGGIAVERVVEGSCGFCIFKAALDPFRLRPRQHGEHGKSVGNLFCVAFGFWARGLDCSLVHPIFFD